MTNSIAQRALTVAVVAATILWSVGFAALVPQQASAAAYGDLIKGATLSTVYYYGSDGQRYSFPNLKTFNTWYTDFSGLVTLSDSELAAIPLGGNIVYRPGSRWIKITSDNKTYATAKNGSVRWIESEAVALGLAGSDWNQNIDDVPDVFFVDYTVGDSLTSAASAYEGALVKSGTDNYLVWGGKKLKVSSAGFTANGFKSGFVLDGSGATLAGLTAGSEVTAKLAYLTDAVQKVTTDEVVSAKDVSISFAGSPSASTLIAGQGVADLAHVTLANNSASEVKLTKIILARTGVSSDTTLSNLYLFDGFVRLSEVATISDGKVTFNDASGLLTLAAGASKEVIVRSDIAASTSGQTVGVKLAAAADLTFSSGGAASGSFPLVGSIHTIAANPSSSFATIQFPNGETANPSANGALDPQEGVVLWNQQVSVGVNEVSLKAARFRNIGSIDAVDVNNWQLYVGGVKRGSAVASEDSIGYVTFDFSAAPVELKTGTHEVKVMADVIGGSGRTVTVGLRNTADFVVVDQDYGQAVKSTVDGTTSFAVMDAGAQTVSSGSIIFTKATDSPSGNVTDTASGVTLGKWTVKAYGEKMKVESLNFYVDESDNDTVFTLRNGAVFLNGSQIGSTAALASNSDATLAYTAYTFGSSFIVTPGTPATLEIRADLVDNDGDDEVADADTLIANIDNTATSNVQQMTSGSYLSRPTTDTAANTLTIAQGALTVAKSGSYSDQSAVPPKTAYKLGAFTVSAGTTEDVNLTDINVDLDNDATVTAATDISNLYVKYGPVSNMVTSSVKGTVAETTNSWSISYTLKKGEIIYVEVYADLNNTLASDGTDVVRADLDVNGTSVQSGTSPSTTEQTGQSITLNAGTFGEFNDDHPVAAIVHGSQEVVAAKYRFSSSNESYTITEMTTRVASATASGLVNEVRLYDGSTLKASTVYDEDLLTEATWTGLSIPVAANATKILTVKYLLNSVGVGAATSQTDVINTLQSVKILDSNGTETTETDVGSANWTAASILGNSQYVFASIPTINAVDLTNSTLVMGQATDLYKFTVTASGGSVALKQFKLNVAWNNGGTTVGDTLEVESLKLYKNGSDITSSITIVDEDGNTVKSTSGLLEADEDAVFTWTTEDTVAQGETVTYTVRGTPQDFRQTGSDTVGDSVSFYLAQDSATNGTSVYLNDADNAEAAAGLEYIMTLFTSAIAKTSVGTGYEFIWSDISAASHASAANASSTGDWHNGFLVKNLDLAGETWSK